MIQAGRFCPMRYRYGASALAKAPVRPADTLYVIGGLYGNQHALEAIETIAKRETSKVTLCFNGDFNWFNCDDNGFRLINERVLQHDAILGNVEAEFSSNADDVGCGCAYPDSVSNSIVERSNQIHLRLKNTAARHPELCAAIENLPMFACYQIETIRIGVIHGDADSLAGWRFDVAELNKPGTKEWLSAAFTKAEVDIFASSHTCLPVMRRIDSDGVKLLANNGAAGMPNFSDTRYGTLTRISARPSPVPTLYGCKLGDVFIDALPVHYDNQRWQTTFLNNWPENSPAWQSYFQRICHGPKHTLERAKCTTINSTRQPP